MIVNACAYRQLPDVQHENRHRQRQTESPSRENAHHTGNKIKENVFQLEHDLLTLCAL